MIDKAEIYIRLSHDDLENPSLSPEHQEKRCREWAKRNGHEVVDVCKDINKTGANIFRKGLQKFTKDAEQRKYKFGYINDWSRLSRDIIDQETIVRNFKELGIEIISLDGIQDSKARQVTGLANQWYIEECKRKAETIHALKISERIPLNRPPFGYRMNRKKKCFDIDKRESEIVKSIFRYKIEGWTLSKIAKEFNLKINTIKNILKNRTYLGYNIYKGNEFVGKHEPIISIGDYQKVNSTSS